MIDTRQSLLERRLLILAPTGRDAELTRSVLAENGMRSNVCDDLPGLVQEMGRGAAAVLVSEEAIASEVHLQYLADPLLRQPTWSDLPILMLSGYAEDQYAVNLLRAGAAGYLNKEAASTQLVGAVRTVVRGRAVPFAAGSFTGSGAANV